MKLEAEIIDFASLARARKVRFIIQALGEYCSKHEPQGEQALLTVAKSLTIEGRQLVETIAHGLAKTKHPKPSSDPERLWLQVISELEARADAVHEAATAEGES